MTTELVQQQLVRSARARRAMPFLWGLIGLYGVAVGAKLYRALQIAIFYDLSGSDSIALLSMRNAERIKRDFSGYEAVFVDYAGSGVVGTMSFGVASLLLVLRARELRREAELLAYIRELEDRVSQ